MIPFINIAHRIGWFFIRRIMAQHPRHVVAVNIAHAKNIAILVNFNEPSAERQLQLQLKLLQPHKPKSIEIIAFKNSWKNDENLTSKEWILASKKDFNWLYLPQNSIKNFTQKKYQLLIHLAVQQNPYITNILALSQATFKVGLNTPDVQPHVDFSIELKNIEAENFTKNLNHYLNLINQNKHVA